jgi:hypothetical protein
MKLVIIQHYDDKWVECCESEPAHIQALYKHCAGCTAVMLKDFEQRVRFVLSCHGVETLDMWQKVQ